MLRRISREPIGGVSIEAECGGYAGQSCARRRHVVFEVNEQGLENAGK